MNGSSINGNLGQLRAQEYANQQSVGANQAAAQYAQRSPMTTADLITEAASRLQVVRQRLKAIQDQHALLAHELDAMQLEETRLVAIINTPGHERMGEDEVPK